MTRRIQCGLFFVPSGSSPIGARDPSISLPCCGETVTSQRAYEYEEDGRGLGRWGSVAPNRLGLKLFRS